MVEKTSNLALVNTFTFDSATSTYTLYVGSEFNKIGVSYDHTVTGNATFTLNNITYGAGTKIPSTDLLFDVTAVDSDGDSSTSSLQVDLLGVTSVASALALSGTPQLAAAAVNSTNDAAVMSGATTGPVSKAGGAGNYAIIGGSGGGQLTGSNGDDVFVYAAVADSNSTRFDTISDFTSGSDKINLAAFGALAFMINPSSFLRRALIADAIFSGVAALGFTFGAGAFASLFNLPEAFLREVGLFLIGYAAFVGWLGTRQTMMKALVAIVIAGNAAWTLGSIALLFSGSVSPNLLGVVMVVAQAIATGVFAELQYIGLRKSGGTVAA